MSHEQIYEQVSNITNDSMVLSSLEKEMLAILIAEVNASLITTGEVIEGTTTPVGAVVSRSLKSFYATKAYQNSLASLLRNIDGIGTDKMSLYKGFDLVIPRKEINKAQTAVLDELIDALNDNGLNTRFNQPLRKIIYDNIRRGKSQTDLTKSLKQFIVSSPDKASDLKRYINTTSIQGADAYSKVVDNEIMKKYEKRVTAIRVVGSLIDSSSPQCRQAVNKYQREIPMDKLPEWIAFAKDHGGSDNLSKDNLSLIGAHYGCRHQWVPIIKPTK